jgi:putative membrane protein
MKQTGKSIFFASLILCLMSVGLLAQQEDAKAAKDKAQETVKPAADKMVDHKDHEFITKVSQGGKTEVELGQLALKQASNADVKQFAQRMIDDHSKTGDELKGLAASKGITLPADLDKKHKETIDKLTKVSAADFDREYMKQMVKDHSMNVTLFEQQAKNGKDADTKAWAEKTLPTLREHLTMARDTASKVGAVKDIPKTK